MTSQATKPLINKNDALQSYYATLESRIGYKVVLGGTRHFGYYQVGTYWPFPIGKALRRMEDHLIGTLGLEKGSKILDAGCGVAHVAIHLAKAGYHVNGIDVVDHHIVKAKRNVKAAGQESVVEIAKGDYHHLDAFPDNKFDGAYTMETFVHATDPRMAAAEFYRVIRPGGSLAMYEYDHVDWSTTTKASSKSWKLINQHAAMPANDMFKQGVLKDILEEVGFEDVAIAELSENVLPMLRMFYILAFVPYLIISLLGLKAYFINTVAGYEGYVNREAVRFVAVSARKPLTASPRQPLENKKAR